MLLPSSAWSAPVEPTPTVTVTETPSPAPTVTATVTPEPQPATVDNAAAMDETLTGPDLLNVISAGLVVALLAALFIANVGRD